MSPDSATYIGGARSLYGMKGFSLPVDATTFSPIVHYPPLYPAFLAILAFLGLEPFAGARWLNVILFGANAVVAGGIAFGVTRRWKGAAAAAGLMITAFPLAQSHTMAWSEPLFIFLELWVWLFLIDYFRSSAPRSLLCAAVAAALAALTRYVGVAIILAGSTALLMLGERARRQRVTEAGLFFSCSSLPLLFWMARNWSLAGSTTNRTLGFHFVEMNRLAAVSETILSWFLGWRPSAATSTLWLGSLFLLAVVVALQRKEGKSAKPCLADFHSVPKLMLLSVGFYLCVLLASIVILDDQTPVDSRILAPVYPALIFLGFGLAAPALDRWRETTGSRWLPYAMVLLLLGFQSVPTWRWLQLTHSEGMGYASRIWRNSHLLQQVKALGPSAVIFTNAPDLLYTVLGRSAYMIPRKINPDTRQPNQDFIAQLDDMKSKLKMSGGVVVHFDRVHWRSYLPDAKELETMLGLRILIRAPDGTIATVN